MVVVVCVGVCRAALNTKCKKCSFKTEHESNERTKKISDAMDYIRATTRIFFSFFIFFFIRRFASLFDLTLLLLLLGLSSSIFVKMASGENTYKRTHEHTQTRPCEAYWVAFGARFGHVCVYVFRSATFVLELPSLGIRLLHMVCVCTHTHAGKQAQTQIESELAWCCFVWALD